MVLGNNENPVTSLPMIVQYLYKDDAGPSDGKGNAVCPHCGADGRYVHYFKVEDGRTLGAMSGCIKLFPISEIAKEDMRLTEKEAEYSAKGWELNSWERRIRASIDSFYAGDELKEDCLATIKREKSNMTNYRAKKRGGRKW